MSIFRGIKFVVELSEEGDMEGTTMQRQWRRKKKTLTRGQLWGIRVYAAVRRWGCCALYIRDTRNQGVGERVTVRKELNSTEE